MKICCRRCKAFVSRSLWYMSKWNYTRPHLYQRKLRQSPYAFRVLRVVFFFLAWELFYDFARTFQMIYVNNKTKFMPPSRNSFVRESRWRRQHTQVLLSLDISRLQKTFDTIPFFFAGEGGGSEYFRAPCSVKDSVMVATTLIRAQVRL